MSPRAMFIASAAALPLLAATTARTATINVPVDQPTIQAGIDSAAPGDTVSVACGTYFERNIDMRSGVTLRSATGLPDCVTIDAQSLGRVIICSGVDGTAQIEGFTLTGGSATRGAGIYCGVSSSPRISRCILTGNTATLYGGGIHCRDFSSPVIDECLFTNNHATEGGGGLDCFNASSPTVDQCTFSGNSSDRDGGGMLCANASAANLEACTFLGNIAGQRGGGFFCVDSNPVLDSCTFEQNKCDRVCWGLWIPRFRPPDHGLHLHRQHGARWSWRELLRRRAGLGGVQVHGKRLDRRRRWNCARRGHRDDPRL